MLLRCLIHCLVIGWDNNLRYIMNNTVDLESIKTAVSVAVIANSLQERETKRQID